MFVFGVFLFLFCVFCVFALLLYCVVYCFSFCFVSCLFLYKSTKHFHRMEIQLQYINKHQIQHQINNIRSYVLYINLSVLPSFCCGSGGSVGIATDCGLDGPGIEIKEIAGSVDSGIRHNEEISDRMQ